jgi:hypothetical protein
LKYQAVIIKINLGVIVFLTRGIKACVMIGPTVGKGDVGVGIGVGVVSGVDGVGVGVGTVARSVAGDFSKIKLTPDLDTVWLHQAEPQPWTVVKQQTDNISWPFASSLPLYNYV